MLGYLGPKRSPENSCLLVSPAHCGMNGVWTVKGQGVMQLETQVNVGKRMTGHTELTDPGQRQNF